MSVKINQWLNKFETSRKHIENSRDLKAALNIFNRVSVKLFWNCSKKSFKLESSKNYWEVEQKENNEIIWNKHNWSEWLLKEKKRKTTENKSIQFSWPTSLRNENIRFLALRKTKMAWRTYGENYENVKIRQYT